MRRENEEADRAALGGVVKIKARANSEAMGELRELQGAANVAEAMLERRKVVAEGVMESLRGQIAELQALF